MPAWACSAVAAAAAREARVQAVEGDRAAARDLALQRGRAAGRRRGTSAQPVEAFVRGRGQPSRRPDRRPAADWHVARGARSARWRSMRQTSSTCPATSRPSRETSGGLIDAGYRLTAVDAFDLFPNTPHVETVVNECSSANKRESNATAKSRARSLTLRGAVRLRSAWSPLRGSLRRAGGTRRCARSFRGATGRRGRSARPDPRSPRSRRQARWPRRGTRRDLLDRLVMAAVRFARVGVAQAFAHQAREQRVLVDPHFVREVVGLVRRHRPAVLQRAGHLGRDVLHERAAAGDVQDLDAAADREDRQVACGAPRRSARSRTRRAPHRRRRRTDAAPRRSAPARRLRRR